MYKACSQFSFFCLFVNEVVNRLGLEFLQLVFWLDENILTGFFKNNNW